MTNPIRCGVGECWYPPAHNASEALPQRSVAVIIPALDEEASVGGVIERVPRSVAERVLVVDNGSRDRTAERAQRAGAEVVFEPKRGYGAACLRGIEYLSDDPPEVVAFLDADASDRPEELGRLLEPIARGAADFVVGSRMIGAREPGALLPQAIFGNRLATSLIRRIYGYRFTDLGPFRAIRWGTLSALRMEDEDYGWTVEMQLKAARLGVPSVEVPVSYMRRVGVSKITGTVRGSVSAGAKILATIGRHAAMTKLGVEL